MVEDERRGFVLVPDALVEAFAYWLLPTPNEEKGARCVGRLLMMGPLLLKKVSVRGITQAS